MCGLARPAQACPSILMHLLATYSMTMKRREPLGRDLRSNSELCIISTSKFKVKVLLKSSFGLDEKLVLTFVC